MTDEHALDALTESDVIQEPYVLVREYSFRLGNLLPVITVRVYFDGSGRDPYRFGLSHYIQTPEQAGPYVPSGPTRATEREALRAAVTSLTNFYNLAVRNGHEPNSGWLKPRGT